MKVTVECYGIMREYLPPGTDGRSAPVELSGTTVADLVDALGAPRRLVHAILVDGARARLDAKLEDGARVTLMPPFAGG